MKTYANINKEAELWKIKTRDDEIKIFKYQTEKDDHENILKSLKTDKDYQKKKFKSPNKKKILIIITEHLFGSGSASTSSTFSLNNRSIGTPSASCSALLTSIAILINYEYISKLKNCYTKLRDWINVVTLLYEKTLKQSLVDKNIHEKEAQELKKIYNHYHDESKVIMKITQFKFEHKFGDIINKDNISQDQIFKLNNFLAKMTWKKALKSNLTILDTERKKIMILNLVLLLNMNEILSN